MTLNESYRDLMIEKESLFLRQMEMLEQEEFELTQLALYKKSIEDFYPNLRGFPTLVSDIESNLLLGRTSSFYVFILKKALTGIKELENKEADIRKEVEIIKQDFSIECDESIDSIIQQISEWRFVYGQSNYNEVAAYLIYLSDMVNDIRQSLDIKDRERRSREESKSIGVSQSQLDKEEKHRLAQEEFKRQMNVRKKK